MLDTDKLDGLLAMRRSTDDEDEQLLGERWGELADFLTACIPDTVEWLGNDCTRDQLEWTSEVFDDMLERSNDPRLVEALVNACDRLIIGDDTYHVRRMLQEAIYSYADDETRDQYLRKDLLPRRMWDAWQQQKAMAAHRQTHEERNPLF